MKIKIFEIPIYDCEFAYEVYYKGGYYTVEQPHDIFKKTRFSGSLEQCKDFLRELVLIHYGFPVSFKELA